MTSWPREALAGAAREPFWTDRDDAPVVRPPVQGVVHADLAIVGGGLTGLWAAVDALGREPGRSVVVLEAASVGFGASTRNAGMLDQSLTHGPENGAARWPGEIDMLVRFGRENFDEIIALLNRHSIDVDLRRVAALDVATHAWQMEELVASSAAERASGDDSEMLDAAATQARVASPTYVGAMLRRNHYALVDPAQLVWGLTSLVERLGGTVFEHSAVTGIEPDGRLLIVSTFDGHGQVAAERVVMATNAMRAPGRVGRAVRRRVIPVYDHVLMTEPLTTEQQASIGWDEWDGVDDADFQFHYSRRTADGRVLWGGDDATYHFGGTVRPEHDQLDTTHEKLADSFFTTFPQLEGLRFSHRWGGPVGTTTRFTCAWGTEYGGRLAWVAGYTGLGVAASRFGARTALDLVDGLATERTALAMVRKSPMAFPPEPARYAVVNATRRATRRCEDNEGRSGPWLKLLGRFGLGFET
jgi:glycine/D-amino acid oxidase-like deaminating enzyme